MPRRLRVRTRPRKNQILSGWIAWSISAKQWRVAVDDVRYDGSDTDTTLNVITDLGVLLTHLASINVACVYLRKGCEIWFSATHAGKDAGPDLVMAMQCAYEKYDGCSIVWGLAEDVR